MFHVKHTFNPRGLAVALWWTSLEQALSAIDGGDREHVVERYGCVLQAAQTLSAQRDELLRHAERIARGGATTLRQLVGNPETWEHSATLAGHADASVQTWPRVGPRVRALLPRDDGNLWVLHAGTLWIWSPNGEGRSVRTPGHGLRSLPEQPVLCWGQGVRLLDAEGQRFAERVIAQPRFDPRDPHTVYQVYDAFWHPDGSPIIIVEGGGAYTPHVTLRAWSPGSPDASRLPGFDDFPSVRAVVCSGSVLLIVNGQGLATAYDLSSGARLWEHEGELQHAVATEHAFAVAGPLHIEVLQANTGERLEDHPGPEHPWCLAARGDAIAVGDGEGQIWLKSGTRLRGHLDGVSALAWSSAGALFSGDSDGVVKRWRPESAQTNLRSTPQRAPIIAVALMGSREVAALDQRGDWSMWVHDAKGYLRCQERIRSGLNVRRAVLDVDGRRAVVAHDEGVVALEGSGERESLSTENAVMLCWDPQGQRLLWGTPSSWTWLHRATGDAHTRPAPEQRSHMACAALRTGRDQVLVVWNEGLWKEKLELYDLEGALRWSRPLSGGNTRAIAFDASARHALTATGNTLRLWDLSRHTTRRTLTLQGASVTAMAARGQQVVVARGERLELRRLDPSLEILATWEHTAPISACALGSDRVVFGDERGGLHVLCFT